MLAFCGAVCGCLRALCVRRCAKKSWELEHRPSSHRRARKFFVSGQMASEGDFSIERKRSSRPRSSASHGYMHGHVQEYLRSGFQGLWDMGREEKQKTVRTHAMGKKPHTHTRYANANPSLDEYLDSTRAKESARPIRIQMCEINWATRGSFSCTLYDADADADDDVLFGLRVNRNFVVRIGL